MIFAGRRNSDFAFQIVVVDRRPAIVEVDGVFGWNLIFIVDETGRICHEIKVVSHPDDLVAILQDPAWDLVRIGLQAGPIHYGYRRTRRGRTVGNLH